jgi:hypothetical protein
MNLAVSKGAEPGLPFEKYVEYLASKGFIPPDGVESVIHFRQKGSEGPHEIQVMTREDATDMLTFIEMLLRFIYEFPAKMKKKQETREEPIKRISLDQRLNSVDWDFDY